MPKKEDNIFDFKVNKKGRKENKEKKLKVYCGILNPVPKGYRLGSMKECVDLNKVNYYGVKKVDPIILNYKKHEKIEDEKTLQIKKVGLMGKINKLKKDIGNIKDETERNKLKKEYEAYALEINAIERKIKMMKSKKEKKSQKGGNINESDNDTLNSITELKEKLNNQNGGNINQENLNLNIFLDKKKINNTFFEDLLKNQTGGEINDYGINSTSTSSVCE